MSGNIKTKQQYLEVIFNILKKRFENVKIGYDRKKNKYEPFHNTHLKLYWREAENGGLYYPPAGFYISFDCIGVNVKHIQNTHDFIITVLHEMVHAYTSKWYNYDGCGDHQGTFIEVGKQVGLKRPWTSQSGTEKMLREAYPWVQDIIDKIGELPEENGEVIPYAELDKYYLAQTKIDESLLRNV